MKLLKKLTLTGILCLFCFSLFAQVDNDTVAKAPSGAGIHKKYFNSIYGDAIDILVSPYTLVPNYVYDYNGNGNTYTQQGNSYARIVGIDLVSFGYKGWYNIIEFNDNSSISLGAMPTLGFGLAVGSGLASDYAGFLNFQMPVLAEFHIGNGATYNTSKEKGFTIGGGIEFIKTPLFPTSNKSSAQVSNQTGGETQVDFKTAWIEPCVDAGVTFWTKSSHAIEVTAKYGFGNHNSFIADDGVTKVSGGSGSYMLGAILYLGY